MSEILIKNGFVADGAGETPVKKDVLLRGERIARLGYFPQKKSAKVVDATGAIVVPGFIDINSPIDHYLEIFTENQAEKLIREGVTTVLGGNCGASLAPLLDGSLRSLKKWSELSKINTSWHSFPEFLKVIEKRGVGVNFGTLVGHETLRRGILNDERRDLTERELETLKKILKRALKDGAYGFSTGLEYTDANLVSAQEIIELVKIVTEAKGVYATHLRAPILDLKKSLAETLAVARQTGVSVEISHFLPIKGLNKEYSEAKEMIEKETAETQINFDCYPSPFVSQPILELLPPTLTKDNPELILVNLAKKHLEKLILAHFQKFRAEDIVISHIAAPLKFLAGRTLKDFAESHNLTPPAALLKLMKLSRLQAIVLQKTADARLLEEFLVSPSSFVASGETELPVFGDFIKWSLRTNKLSFEKAVAKITSLPAGKYKIKKRGLIKEDYYADIAVLRDNRVSDVILNGELVLEGGIFKNRLVGHVLKHSP